MKTLLLLSFFLTSLFSWSFTDYDYYQLTKEQRNNLDIIYMVGEEKDLGLTLGAISIVETRLDLATDTNRNHICGIMQLNSNYVDVPCEAIESNIYLSAKLARENFLFWYNGPAKRNWRKALIMYNGGYKFNHHGYEYVKRIIQVYKVLKLHYKKL